MYKMGFIVNAVSCEHPQFLVFKSYISLRQGSVLENEALSTTEAKRKKEKNTTVVVELKPLDYICY